MNTFFLIVCCYCILAVVFSFSVGFASVPQRCEMEAGNNTLSVEKCKKWPFPQGHLRYDTEEIKILFSDLFDSFTKSFLARQEEGKVKFRKLAIVAKRLFNFKDKDIELLEQNSEDLLYEIYDKQSYLNFDLVMAVIRHLGSSKDINLSYQYKEKFMEYARRRIYQIPANELSNILPGHENLVGHDSIMFVLENTYELKDVYVFKKKLCNLLKIEPHEFFLIKIGPGSIAVSFQVPTEYLNFFSTIPLYFERASSLIEWHTKSYRLKEEVVNLGKWRIIIDSLDFSTTSLIKAANFEVVPALGESNLFSLKYTKSFSDESTADVDYIKYLDIFLSGQYKDCLPAVRGVYYNSISDKKCDYPSIVIENFKPLNTIVFSEQKFSELTEISVLSDLTHSIACFEQDKKLSVSVSLESVFVGKSIDPDTDISARFCPLYGHSFCVTHTDSNDQLLPSLPGPLPLERLQWMIEILKFIHFQGSVAEITELPHDHILKRIFEQKWICLEDRFRPKDFKSLQEQLLQLLGMSFLSTA